MNRWNEFYQSIRDPSWPDCATENEFSKLPNYIQDEILQVHCGAEHLKLSNDNIRYLPLSWTQPTQLDENNFPLKFAVANDFFVYYNHNIEGGGIHNGQNFPRIIRYLYPNRIFEHGMEWAAGHGAIGFRLLADNICKKIHLVETHQSAINACKKTIDNMPARFKNTITLSHTSTIATLDHSLQFDLIVANPPTYQAHLWTPENFSSTTSQDWVRISFDKDWQAHQDFFANVKKHLTANGTVLLQEQTLGSSVFEFEKFIIEGGLKIVSAFHEKINPSTWYLELAHA
jgi:hypothetical protein